MPTKFSAHIIIDAGLLFGDGPIAMDTLGPLVDNESIHITFLMTAMQQGMVDAYILSSDWGSTYRIDKILHTGDTLSKSEALKQRLERNFNYIAAPHQYYVMDENNSAGTVIDLPPVAMCTRDVMSIASCLLEQTLKNINQNIKLKSKLAEDQAHRPLAQHFATRKIRALGDDGAPSAFSNTSTRKQPRHARNEEQDTKPEGRAVAGGQTTKPDNKRRQAYRGPVGAAATSFAFGRRKPASSNLAGAIKAAGQNGSKVPAPTEKTSQFKL